HIVALGRDVRVEQRVLVLGRLLVPQGRALFGILDGGQVTAVQDVPPAVRAHAPELRGGPGQVVVAAEVLGAHDVVGAAVGLAGDDRDLGHGGLSVGVNELRAPADNSSPFLPGA